MIEKNTTTSHFRIIGLNNKYIDKISNDRISSIKYFVKSFFKNPFGYIGMVLFCLVIMGIIFIPIFAPPTNELFDEVNSGPSAKHWFGTNAPGQDLLSVYWNAAANSMAIGFLVLFFSFFLGIIIGICSAYFKTFDLISQFIIRVLNSVPSLLLYVIIGAVLAPITSRALITRGTVITTFALMFSLFSWTAPSLFVRGQVLRARNLDFITASRVLGTSQWKIVFNFVPIALPILLTNLVVILPNVIFSETTLSILGFSLSGSISTLGSQISGSYVVLYAYPLRTVFTCGILLMITFSMFFMSNAAQSALSRKE